jgi:hypothetical protein
MADGSAAPLTAALLAVLTCGIAGRTFSRTGSQSSPN